ncbi:hypothetical protein KCP75_14695 [Salmonella enterica subsp. enterica]|nr:hypothetical protein KCP75_14695 [Salmonella enterica subsp. enterica]
MGGMRRSSDMPVSMRQPSARSVSQCAAAGSAQNCNTICCWRQPSGGYFNAIDNDKSQAEVLYIG